MAAKVSLNESMWNSTHSQAFEKVKRALRKAATLAHPHSDKLLCLFKDASETRWAGTLTQIPREQIDEPWAYQRHEPLAFLSGSFKNASANWSTPEKEAYAIIASVMRLDYMLMRPEGFILFTDHKNLTFCGQLVKLSVES